MTEKRTEMPTSAEWYEIRDSLLQSYRMMSVGPERWSFMRWLGGRLARGAAILGIETELAEIRRDSP